MSEPDHLETDTRGEDDKMLSGSLDRKKFLSIGAGAAAGVLLGARAAAAAGSPKPVIKRGGTLRVAVQGGGQAETLNPLTSSLDSASTLRSRRASISRASSPPTPRLITSICMSGYCSRSSTSSRLG